MIGWKAVLWKTKIIYTLIKTYDVYDAFHFITNFHDAFFKMIYRISKVVSGFSWRIKNNALHIY